MTLKITIIMDAEAETAMTLIGLLAKALGRGEAGVKDMQIELIREPEKLRPVRQSTIAKLMKTKRSWHTGRIGKGTGAEIGLRIVAKGDPNVNGTLQQAFVEAGLSADGAGATLSKLGKRGFVKNIGPGLWALTARGKDELARLNNESGTRDDDAQPKAD